MGGQTFYKMLWLRLKVKKVSKNLEFSSFYPEPLWKNDDPGRFINFSYPTLKFCSDFNNLIFSSIKTNSWNETLKYKII